MQWSDVDFEERTISISADVTKNKRLHVLPLSNFLIDLLKQRKDCSDSPFVFPRKSGRGQHVVSDWRTNAVLVKAAGCKFTLHELRRTFFSAAAKLGIPHHLIKKLVNHIGKSDVTESYIVCQIEDLREPMEKISQRMLHLMGIDHR